MNNLLGKYVAPLYFIGIGLALYQFLPIHLPYWLGLEDGYYYGTLIKQSLLLHPFESNTNYGYFQYSPYFFWLLGFIGKGLGVVDIGVLQKAGFFLAYLSPILIAILYQKNRILVYVYACGILLFLSLFNRDDIFIIKAQEIFSAFACFGYLYFLAYNDDINNREAILSGVLAGVSFSSYVPSSFIYVLILPLFYGIKLVNRRLRREDTLFAISFFCVLLPYLALQVMSIYVYGSTPLPEYVVDTYYDLANPRINYLILPVSLAILYARKYYFYRKSIYISICLLALLSFSYDLLLFVNSYIVPIQINSLARITSAQVQFFAFTFSLIILCISDKFRSVRRRFAFLSSFICTALIVFVIAGLGKFNDGVKNSVQLTKARLNNVKDCIDFVDKNYPNVKTTYLASGECLFLNYYTPYNSKPYLIFNGDYGTRQDKYLERVLELKSILDSGAPNSFVDYLIRNKISYIVLPNSHEPVRFAFLITSSTHLATKHLEIILPEDYIEYLANLYPPIFIGPYRFFKLMPG